MRAICFVLIVALLPAANATPMLGSWVYFVEDVDARDLHYDTSECISGTFNIHPDGSGFQFAEEGPVMGQDDIWDNSAGFAQSSCGTATYFYEAPERDFHHMHARFGAQRYIDQFVTLAPVDAWQTVDLTGMAGGPIPVFPPNSGSSGWVFIDPPSATPPHPVGRIDFRFDDRTATESVQPSGEAISGIQFNAGVQHLQIEYSLAAADVVLEETRDRTTGSYALKETVYSIRIDEADLQDYGVGIQIRTDPNLEFTHVELPGGGIFDNITTRVSDGPRGFNHDRVLLENFNAGYHQATVTPEIVAKHGPGVYTVVFHERNALTPTLGLYPLAAIALLGPGFAGGWASYGVGRLSRARPTDDLGAVGDMRRNMWIVGGAYLAALVGILTWVGMRAMATTPTSLKAIMAYILMFVLAALFALQWLTAQRHAERAAIVSQVELQRYAHDLERSNADLEQFAHVASHDLKEPLRSVRNYTSLLHRRYHDKLDDEANTFLQYTEDSVARMQALLDDLVVYSHAATDRSTAEVDLNQVVAEVKRDLAVQVREAGAHIQTSNLPTIFGSREQWGQVLQNLVSNAIKFRDPSRGPRVHIRGQEDGNHWVIQVEDNGVGIDARNRSRIFHMFYRLHDRDKYEGTGIGLAVVRKIIDRNGGTIEVASTPGEGTIFTLRIPKQDESVK